MDNTELFPDEIAAENTEYASSEEENPVEYGENCEEACDDPSAPVLTDEADFESLINEDLEELKREFTELRGIADITEIKNPLRYAALRDLGLTPTEAYLAARGNERRRDNRAHLCGTVPAGLGVREGSMPKRDLLMARELFNGMSDSEIQALFRKVTR